MCKKQLLWSLLLACALNFHAAYAEEKEQGKNAGIEKYNELVKKYNKERKAGEQAEYSINASMGNMTFTGKAVAEVKEVKEDGTVTLTWTQTLSVMGQDQTNSVDVTVPNSDNFPPDAAIEFSTGEVKANGVSYKDCEIVTVSKEFDGPVGKDTLTITLSFAPDKGLVKMEQSSANQGSQTTELTKPYATPE